MPDYMAELEAELRRVEQYVGPPPPLRPRPTIADYEAHLAVMRRRSDDAFGHLRDLVLIGLRAGTISVDDLYHGVRPAMVALSVLVDSGAGAETIGPDFARLIRREAGREVERWAEAIVAVDSWSGSLRSLLRQEPPEPEDPAAPKREVRPVYHLLRLADHLWRGANILLALAPPETLAYIAAEATPMPASGPITGEPRAIRYARAMLRIASHAPLSRIIVDHALMPEASARVRIQVAANSLTPNATLIRLLTFADAEQGVAAAISLHQCASPAVRLAAYRKVRDREVQAQAREALQRDADVVRRVQMIAAAGADDAERLHALLRAALPTLPVEAQLFAYAHLARISGIEAVWTLEMDRAGGLERMHPAVRASMESGTAVPLLEAAVAEPYRGMDHDVVTSVSALRREEVLDRPFPWLEPVDWGPAT